MGRGVFLSLKNQARFTNYCLSCVWTARPGVTELPGQDAGLRPPLFDCPGARPRLLLLGFVVQQTSFLE